MDAIETHTPPEIDTYEDPQDPEVRGGWIIKNQISADWAVQRVAECEAEMDAVEAQYLAAVTRLDKRREELLDRAARGAGYFRFKLAQWAEQNRSSLLKGKAKSVQLLHGSLGWRKTGGRLKVEDKEALAAWLAEQLPGSTLVRVKYEPEMKALQEHFKITGECPPGCEPVPEGDEFYVKPIAPDEALTKE